MSPIIRNAQAGDEAAVQNLVFSILREYGLKPDPDGTDADLRDLVGGYESRGGMFRILAGDDGQILGCGGLYPLSSEEVEIRKMYLSPTQRGQGLGKRMLTDLIVNARQLGFQKISLETASVLKEAIQLYKSFGFEPSCHAPTVSRCDQAYSMKL